MVDFIQIFSMNPRVIEAFGGDLRKLTGSDPSGWDEWVDFGDETLPVTLSIGLGGFGELSSKVEKTLVIAVPLVGFHGEGI
jgi:hypothetical protein